ncbi:response regulator, partial [Synechococcus sp. WC101]|uniref:response regulator n=1 Tax=Synechococcus sp. WC101 TaxID=2964536 RepID=UPI0039C1C0E3
MPAQVPCIWVIDDDPVNRRYIGEVLKSSNYRVESWESGQLAWEHLQTLDESEWPDLIICDWVMPGLSGVELCRRLKNLPAGQFIYFILLTARSEVEDRVQGLDAGADEFIAKPIDPEELRARVRAGLRLQRLTQALAQANRQLRARNELLESLSLTDPLTGALNRRALDQALPHLLKQVGPREQARYRYLCLLMMDVDYFKQV